MPRLSTTGRRPPPESVPPARSARCALLRRPGPALGALLLLLATLLAGASAARADVLVSNFDQVATDSGFLGIDDNHPRAQPFTTGSHAAGYSLESIELAFVEAVPAADIDDLGVSVWTTDGDGRPMTEQFTLTNPASIAAATLDGDRNLTGNFAVFTAPASAMLTASTSYAIVVEFDDSDGATLHLPDATVSDRMVTGAAGWSIPDESFTRAFSLTWPTADSNGLSAFIRVNGAEKVAATNNAPTVATEIPDRTATVDVLFTYQFPDTTFADADTGDTLTYSAVESGETGLPTWLDFNATTRTFSGTPTATDVETLAVKVTASDGTDSATDTFDIVVSADTACPAPTGRRNIWRGVVTVGTHTQFDIFTLFHGFSSVESPAVGALDDTTFTIGSNNYTINRVTVASAASSAASTSSPGELVFSLTSAPTATEVAALRLHVCDTGYDFNAATFDSSFHFAYVWSTSLDWSTETTVTLYLSLPANNDATGEPTISGTATVGQTLTAANGTIADADGLPTTFEYQWVREDDGGSNPEDIAGATASTYTLAAADAGKKVKVRVSFTDSLNGVEVRTSDPYPETGTVAPTLIDVTVSSTPASGDTYGADEAITFAAEFAPAVTVTGAPTFAFDLGGTTKSAAYVSGSESTTLTFSYTVTAGDADPDGISWAANALALDGGAIELTTDDAAAAEDAVLTHDAKDADAAHKVDAIAPTLRSAVLQDATIILLYDEPLDTGSTPAASAWSVSVAGTAAAPTGVTVSGSQVELTLAAAPAEDAEVTVTYTVPTANPVQDAAGNDAGALSAEPVSRTLIRLVGGAGDHEGRVEVFHNGQWGTVCDDYWTKVEADVACRMAGYPEGSIEKAGQFRRAHFGQGTGPIWLDNVNCAGGEGSLFDCRNARGGALVPGEHNCEHREDVGVRCRTATVPRVTSIELSTAPGGSWTANETVEVTLVWSEPVSVTTPAGGAPPKVWLNIERAPHPIIQRPAVYASGSGTARTVFRYTLVYAADGLDMAGWYSSAQVLGNSLRRRDGTIRSVANAAVDAVLAHDGYPKCGAAAHRARAAGGQRHAGHQRGGDGRRVGAGRDGGGDARLQPRGVRDDGRRDALGGARFLRRSGAPRVLQAGQRHAGAGVHLHAHRGGRLAERGAAELQQPRARRRNNRGRGGLGGGGARARRGCAAGRGDARRSAAADGRIHGRAGGARRREPIRGRVRAERAPERCELALHQGPHVHRDRRRHHPCETHGVGVEQAVDIDRRSERGRTRHAHPARRHRLPGRARDVHAGRAGARGRGDGDHRGAGDALGGGCDGRGGRGRRARLRGDVEPRPDGVDERGVRDHGRHGDGGRGLRGGVGHAHLRGGRDLEDGVGAGPRRRPRRGRGDDDADALGAESGGVRAPGRCGGDGDHHQHRPDAEGVDGPVRAHRRRPGARCGDRAARRRPGASAHRGGHRARGRARARARGRRRPLRAARVGDARARARGAHAHRCGLRARQPLSHQRGGRGGRGRGLHRVGERGHRRVRGRGRRRGDGRGGDHRVRRLRRRVGASARGRDALAQPRHGRVPPRRRHRGARGRGRERTDGRVALRAHRADRAAHGVGARGGGVLTPYAGMDLGDGGRRWRLGARWRLGEAAALGLEAVRDATGEAGRAHALTMHGALRF